MIEIGCRQAALASERFVDRFVEGGIVAGRVIVPDLVIARIGRLPKRLELAKRNLRERPGAPVLIGAERSEYGVALTGIVTIATGEAAR